ncbi:hypothetical protein Tco_0763056 [Tanacetum coccineum]
MNAYDKTLGELHVMLKTIEKNVPSNNVILSLNMIREGGVRIKLWSKGKGRSKGMKKISPLPKKKNPTKNVECFHYRRIRHWKSICPSYLAESRKNKDAGSSRKLGLFMIKLFVFSLNSWIFDKGRAIYICKNVWGLSSSERMEKGFIDLHMGNENRVVVEAFGSSSLSILVVF